MNQRKVSISDVARRAKVSITTVSRVINNAGTVSKKNRAKVEEAVAHLKYKPNVSAQRLARGTNTAIGLVMPGYPGIFYSFYAIEIIRGVGHGCETMQLDMVFHITNGFNPLNTNTVGGVIFADIIENRRQVEQCIQSNTPCLIINNHTDDLDVNYIAVDNRKGGSMAADYLFSLGHKRVATVTGNLHTQAGAERFEGFKESCVRNGVELRDDYIVKGDYSRRAARDAAEKFVSLKERPTAIFAASDEMASEMVAVLNEHGLKVPNDVSIIGFDDSPLCLFGSVALTTIRQPLFQMAADAVRELHHIVEKKNDARHCTLLEPELIVRDSCAALR